MLELTDISALPTWLQAVVGALATLVSEDATLLGLSLLLSAGQIAPWVYWVASVGGILLGDALLYAAGRFGRGSRRHVFGYDINALEQRMASKQHYMFLWLMMVQLLPGLRLPTYVAAGLVRYPFWLFLFAKLVMTPVWAWLILQLGENLFALLRYNGMWFLLILLLLVLFYRNVRRIIGESYPLTIRQKIRLFCANMAKYRYPEFWPSWLFYLPSVVMIVWLTAKYKGRIALPTAANPALTHGGLVGETKSEALQLFPSAHPAMLRFAVLPAGSNTEALHTAMQQQQLTYPIILKPETGQRGVGVALISTEAEAKSYLQRYPTQDILLQEYAAMPHELGVLVVKEPGEKEIRITSITQKIFPSVTGDGRRNLASLILDDPRAIYMAHTYFSRFEERLNWVPQKSEIIKLVESGNHAQGCIFKDGRALETEALKRSLQTLLADIDGIYFGRFDLRYASKEALEKGEYKLIELNGSGAEPTHIYDASCSLKEIYGSLYAHYAMLFKLGDQCRQNGTAPSHLRDLLRLWWHAIKQRNESDVAS